MSYRLTDKERDEANELLIKSVGKKRDEVLEWLSEISLREIILLCKLLECSVGNVDSAILRYWAS